MLVQAEIVRDDELPDDVDRLLVERTGREPLWLIKESVVPKAFAEVYRGRRRLREPA